LYDNVTNRKINIKGKVSAIKVCHNFSLFLNKFTKIKVNAKTTIASINTIMFGVSCNEENKTITAGITIKIIKEIVPALI
jgi:hypothetical protein